MTTTSSQKPENRTEGILWMLATMAGFIALDAMMKLGLAHHSLVQVTWARFFFATIFAMILCGRRLPALARSTVPKFQILRSLLLMCTTGLFNFGIMSTPLATATTIMFLSPILVTLLSIFLLGEHVGVRRWASILVGFIGAVVVVQPWQHGMAGIGSGLLALLTAALFNASYQITTRQTRGDNPWTSLLYTAVAGAVVTSALLPWYWSTPTLFTGGLLVGTGLVGCLSHLCLIRAFRAAPASVVAPFSYSALIWATLLGYLIWSDWPNLNTWLGAVLIIGSGLYIFLRERHLKLAEGATQPATVT
jgi:drug/metabolite transporter (DMT)-like permease